MTRLPAGSEWFLTRHVFYILPPPKFFHFIFNVLLYRSKQHHFLTSVRKPIKELVGFFFFFFAHLSTLKSLISDIRGKRVNGALRTILVNERMQSFRDIQ